MYLATFGIPSQYRGRDAIAGLFQSVRALYPGFQFENIKVLIDTPDQAFGEFEFTAVSSISSSLRARSQRMERSTC